MARADDLQPGDVLRSREDPAHRIVVVAVAKVDEPGGPSSLAGLYEDVTHGIWWMSLNHSSFGEVIGPWIVLNGKVDWEKE